MVDYQKILRMRVTGHAMATARELTLAASDGYQYGGHAHVLGVGGGAIYTRPSGAYTDVCLVWLNPAKSSSLFHSWIVRHRGSKETLSKLEPIIEYENRNGFRLIDLVPLDGFMKDEAGPGTVAYHAIFERGGDVTLPMTLDRWVMKEERHSDEQRVPCPVIGCTFAAPRMSRDGVNLDDLPEDRRGDFMCPRHRIYISPTTFEYEDPRSSILWQNPEELKLVNLLENLTNGKRTWKRMGRERDEDSLTWNVFRYLDRNKMLGRFLDQATPRSTWLTGAPRDVEKIIYWSVDLVNKGVLDELKAARTDLGESETHGSEPDLILVADQYVVLLEVKFTSPVLTKKDKIAPYYLDNERSRARDVFTCDPGQALDTLGYELFRFFLLGEALGRRLHRIPVVALLTRDGVEPDLNTSVQGIIRRPRHAFAHITWGCVRDVINRIFSDRGEPALEFEHMLLNRYFEGKTSGYDPSGKLTTLF